MSECPRKVHNNAIRLYQPQKSTLLWVIYSQNQIHRVSGKIIAKDETKEKKEFHLNICLYNLRCKESLLLLLLA